MNFDLKRVKYSEHLSEETPAFTCEIWENGKLIAYCKNDGCGGNNLITPAKGYTYNDVAKFDTSDVECKIFDMIYIEDHIKKNQSTGFVFFKNEGDDLKLYTAKFPMPISKLKKTKNYNTWLKMELEYFEKEGFIALNRNLK